MGCCDTSGLMPVSEAISAILQTTQALKETEFVSLKDALNRVTAEDVYSPINVPPFANSAMDGYAVHTNDLDQQDTLTLQGKSFAGIPFEGELKQGECIRIMTGAEIPKGANAVIMQEQTQVIHDKIQFLAQVKPNQNIRPLGDDILQGALVLTKGKRLTARDVPLLATLGIDQIRVYRRPVVAFFSTGDELKPVGEVLAKGEIYDSNRYTIHAMLEKVNCDSLDLGVIPDDPQQLEAAFLQASMQADVIITSGGVSVGEADFTKDILAQTGQVDFWKLAIKPGKPFAFGRVGNAIFCGLPGNPVSVLVTFSVLVHPMLAKLAGHSQWQPPIQLKAKAETPFKKSPGRTDYQRATYRMDEFGQVWVSSTGNQGSGAFSSLSKANCFAILEQERGSIEIGEWVSISPFDASLN